MPKRTDVAKTLMEHYGRTYSEELGIRLQRNSPSELFKWLVASILMSARIRSSTAVEAARALFDQGWTSARKMASSTWAERTKALNRAGYARYDERTSRMLGDTAELLQERFGGDLRRLRDEAGRDPRRERQLLKGFKGMGDVGVDIFFREVQSVWGEVAPFVDQRAARAAERLGLPKQPQALSRLVPAHDLPRLVATLARVDVEKAYGSLRGAIQAE